MRKCLAMLRGSKGGGERGTGGSSLSLLMFSLNFNGVLYQSGLKATRTPSLLMAYFYSSLPGCVLQETFFTWREGCHPQRYTCIISSSSPNMKRTSFPCLYINPKEGSDWSCFVSDTCWSKHCCWGPGKLRLTHPESQVHLCRGGISRESTLDSQLLRTTWSEGRSSPQNRGCSYQEVHGK